MSGNETTSNQRHFYPRPPQGGRQFNIYGSLRIAEFLSTPSARRATVEQEEPELGHEYFYPRPPRGGRRNPLLEPGMWRGISIHALRKEGDRIFSDPTKVFPISIHALRKEGDRRHRGRV